MIYIEAGEVGHGKVLKCCCSDCGFPKGCKRGPQLFLLFVPELDRTIASTRVMEVWPCAEETRNEGGTVVGKLKRVRYSMCRVMAVVIQRENAAETKYSLW